MPDLPTQRRETTEMQTHFWIEQFCRLLLKYTLPTSFHWFQVSSLFRSYEIWWSAFLRRTGENGSCSETPDQSSSGLPRCCLSGFARFCMHWQRWFPTTHHLQKLCVQTQYVTIHANARTTYDCVWVTDNGQCVYLENVSRHAVLLL